AGPAPSRRREGGGDAAHPAAGTAALRVVAANRLCPSLADLHRHLVPLRAGLHAVGRIEAEDVLRAQLVLNVRVDASELARGLDVVHVPAGLRGELTELVARVDLRRTDADADRVDRHRGALRVLDGLLERELRRRVLAVGDQDERLLPLDADEVVERV